MYLVTQEARESMAESASEVSEGVTVVVLSQGWLSVAMLVVLGGLEEVGSRW